MSTSSGVHKISSVRTALDYAVATHIGQRREENQDSFGVAVYSDFAFFAVADGMGGASGGAHASALAVRILEDQMGRRSADSLQDRVKGAIQRANQEIFAQGRTTPALEGMGTTMSGFAISLEGLLLFNVGDSRVYRIRGNTITQLSIDHTLVSELLNTGALTQEQANRSPVSHMLTRSVGPAASVEIDCAYLDEPPCAEDIYLICSDGLYNTISSAEIGYVIGEYRLHDALEHLVALANMRGGADNITGILVECGSGFPPAFQSKPEEASSEDETSSDRKKFVHVDLAEAAAADTFSKVKKEVDISAEILWGAHKETRRTATMVKDEATAEPLVAPLPEDTISQRVLVLAGLVFCSALVAVVWIKKMDSEMARSPRPSEFRKDQNILDLSAERAARKEALVDRRGADEEAARRKELVARLQSGEASLSDSERFEQRKKRLVEAQAHVSSQLEQLSKPVDPSVLETQREIETQRLALEERIRNVGQEVEKLDKSLVQWRRRLQEIDEIDTVNLASELAPYSEELKGRQEAFERVTYTYLKELENQKIDPANPEVQARIEQLIKERNQRLSDMAQVSRKVIESMISRDSRDQGLLLIENDALREDEKVLISDANYVRVRINGSADERKVLENGLRSRLEQIGRELAEITPKESPVASPADVAGPAPTL